MEPSELSEPPPPVDVDDGHEEEEEEEEVEIFSADVSAGSSAPSSDRASLLPPATRRCVSKDMLEQMPTLNINVCRPSSAPK
ncbi:unnamed protein product [Phytophthora fragariaefolia]|uniref:Unnamed protein product n=1 Tax=Phytophthora fragariaefolia TaxID=1490495 RepID=A0A9W7D4H2_9STRA|nr:unnamed protein product [Phytophthora fragariaefolia]